MASCKTKGTHQVNLGILFHYAHVIIWVIAIPAIPFTVIIHVQSDLLVFIWSNSCASEFGPHLPWTL